MMRARMGGSDPIRILMICSGNICRSPLAECVLRKRAIERGAKDRLHIDSAGIGSWHAGECPDPRVCDVASRNGVVMTGTAREITRGDLSHFDMLVCMDQSHREHVLHMGAAPARVRMLLEFDPACGSDEVPDPYYGGAEGFEAVYRLIDSACERLLERVLAGEEGAGGTKRAGGKAARP
jgi:protein-tyrosine phosphatase